MEGYIETTRKVTLILNEAEVDWLKSLMQNPFNGLSPMEESEEDQKMRLALWNVLGGANG